MALQHMSESVFVGLCYNLGTSQEVAMRRDVADIRDVVDNKGKTSGENSVMVNGSNKEGFRLEGSDIDYMYWRNDHRVIWELSQSQYYNTHRQTLILCDCSESPPGYTLLYLLSTSRDEDVQRACFRMNNRFYISSSEYRNIWCSALSPDSIQHGPCASGTFGSDTEYDFADCFVSDFWSPSASSWIDRCRSWPQTYIVDDIVKNGCHFVAIGHKLGHHESNEWRISFSLAEHKLVGAMNHYQFLTYGLLKLFLTEIINNGLSDADKLLCSYHTKTAVFWVIQQNKILYWCPQNFMECFWVCFKLILKWVYEGVCPNFFIPQNNMFLGKIHGEAQHQLLIKLYGLYEKGIAFLLHSPSIRSCIINVLYNPHLFICSDEHTLIPEMVFNIVLFQEICKYCTLSTPNLVESYMKNLHRIEQMIGLPLLTQYQAVMLQKLTAYVLQSTAFMLHIETYTHKNKLRYRADKISCYMPKLAAKFGCITDMLYIAIYYYNGFRYMEALSVIEMIKVKLAQPYVIYGYNVDIEMYTTCKTLGGQSWSKKMRQAVAWDINLDNKIHYMSELIPEQQSAIQNRETSLHIPPFILLYMLEILCYRHIDTMRLQTALDDLQTLVHYDQGQFIPLHLRDITWQILGICQQVTGNLQAALYSYQQSLRQAPFNSIHRASEMRIQGSFH
ncbi:uncharacterized protein LOC134248486 [Saccostrea cucullata]|uniref:uncharacterized protein LOC134248486 n=1 Tax=Saccostrea cuccullata TaxID=36930 RepID=UPI002ED06E92